MNNLTKKQKEYLAYLASGLSVKETAAFCNVSKHTVRNTITKAKERIGATSTSNLVATAVVKGWIELDDEARPFMFHSCQD
jgi:DNA-binding CsgD family transcriptional regulator